MSDVLGHARSWRCSLVAALLLATAGAGRAEQGPPHKWWQSDQYQRALGLTAEQSARIEQIFQATLPKLQESKELLDRLEAQLSKAIRDDTTDELEIARLIDRVEAARSELSKTRTLMLFRIHRVLTPEQRENLRRLHQHGDRDRRRPGRSRP